MKFNVNYAYQGTNNKKRTGALIIEAKDLAQAKELATKQLNAEHDWHKITSAAPV